jgi:hemoglobin
VEAETSGAARRLLLMRLYVTSRRRVHAVSVAAIATILAIASSSCATLLPDPARGGAAAPSAPTKAPAPAAAAPGAVASPVVESNSLYRRLGGYDALAAFTDDFLGRATNDPAIVPFFKGLTAADLRRIRQHVLDQLCAATGGPCFYPGRDMKAAHAELEITNDVWNAFTGHLNETVSRFKIGERERNELVGIVSSLRAEIVNK